MKQNRTGYELALSRFHTSLYISLALACACLTFVEWAFLPEIVVLAGLVLGAMIIAYRAESKWSLSLRAANAVGAIIALLLVAWAAYHFLRPQGTLLDYLPIQAAMLVYLGPLVMILIPAKLFRPKHTGDYWSMQLIGLMTVALACALGGNSGMLIFVIAYAVSAVWCLTNFHAVLNSNAITVLHHPDPGEVDLPRVGLWTTTPLGNGISRGLKNKSRTEFGVVRVGLWTAMAMALALVFSLATPRNSDAQWGVGGLAPRASIGISDDRPQIDLNFTGDLESSNEVAFVVRAENVDRQPKLDLSPAQKWRGNSFNFYDQGKWANRGWPRQSADMNPGDRGFGRGRPLQLPSQGSQQLQGLPVLGPKQYFLIFPFPQKPRGTYYLANPVWPPSTRIGFQWIAPVVTETPDGPYNWTASRDGEVYPPPLTLRGDRTQYFYRQVTAPTLEPNLSMPVVVDPGLKDQLMLLVGLKPLRKYSSTLMQQLITANQLPSLQLWTPDSGPLPVDGHEEVARAMEKYFHSSGQFEYSTQGLHRVDLNIDPIEDFLLNIRQGHCNRFATALTLVLRAQGIPSRIVLGYEGCEPNGDGSYTVRQMHAHSWVECLVRRTGADGNSTWHWLTLDPTPSIERVAAAENRFAKWLENTIAGFGEFIRTFVMELNAERQDRARATLTFLSPMEWGPRLFQLLKTPVGWITFGGIVFGILFLRRMRLKKELSISQVYRQLRGTIEKAHSFDASAGMTPRELRQLAQRSIDSPDAVRAANSIIDCHAASMYGGSAIKPAELSQMNFALRTVADYCSRQRRPQSVPIAN